jgi:peptidoglycan/xylan/chitin deacetylase (PgdA/CDA1 family)
LLSHSSSFHSLEDAAIRSRLLFPMSPPDNRAVSALFRVFGGAGRQVVADAGKRADCRGMHGGECAALAILVPLTVLVALGEQLVHVFGMTAGCLLAVPLGLVALHVLPFCLGAKSQSMQWRLWLTACVTWAALRREGGGVVGVFSYVWIGIAVMNLAAALVLGWQASMRWSGKSGIAWRMSLLVLVHAIAVGMGFIWGWPWALAGGAAIALICCRAVLNPYCRWLGPVHCTTDSDEIVITIDDGPDPHDTPVLLDLLDRYQTKAIFFMIGEKVRAHPELAREVVRRGHEIGNHTLTHPASSFWCAGPWRTHREIAGCQQVVEELTGKKPRWFRAPVGHRNLFTHPVAGILGLEVMAWNRRGFDAVERDAGKVLARILPHLTHGDIVLLHEATPIAAEVLEGLLENASSHAVQLDRVSYVVR